MTTDTRPPMTDDAFEQLAGYVDDNWWMTGEDLIHNPELMNVEGWGTYGSTGNLSLTDAQRTLMLWSDVVGQVSNGGFEQLCDNYPDILEMMREAIDGLGWSNLSEHFVPAMTEQLEILNAAGQDVAEPEEWTVQREDLIQHIIRSDDPETKDEEPSSHASHRFMLDKLAAEISTHKSRRFWHIFRKNESSKTAREWIQEFYSDEDLKHLFSLTFEEVNSTDTTTNESRATKAFDKWFFSEACKQESVSHIRAFILQNRGQLYRSV